MYKKSNHVEKDLRDIIWNAFGGKDIFIHLEINEYYNTTRFGDLYVFIWKSK